MSNQFKGIIVCGFGQKLFPLTESTPKPVVTVGNKAVISYVIEWCHQSQLNDLLVLSPASFSNQLTPLLKSHSVHYNSVDDDTCVNWETADWLRHFAHLINSDFIILPCDIIPPPSLPLSSLLQQHKTSHYNTLITCLLYYNHLDYGTREGPAPFTCIHDKSSNTLLIPPSDSLDGVDLKTRLLWEFPNLSLSTKLLDAHVYIVRKGVLDLLIQRPQISSIREDLLPWLCKWSYQKGLGDKWSHLLHLAQDPFIDALTHSTTQSCSNSPEHRLRVQYFIHNPNDGLIARANTLGTYAELNREILRTQKPAKSVITADNVKIGEKSLIKMSIIGNNVVIGKGCKIIGSIIADNVVIRDGAKLDNCIVCTRVKIGERATLTLCDVGGDSDVLSDTHAKNEKISLDGSSG
ncbi:hypothetical protein E3P78_00120 [Wallemia ichthyophaga]|nr:hypothetical protein E3P78_00120 [Wallemia ichthyophaga]